MRVGRPDPSLQNDVSFGIPDGGIERLLQPFLVFLTLLHLDLVRIGTPKIVETARIVDVLMSAPFKALARKRSACFHSECSARLPVDARHRLLPPADSSEQADQGSKERMRRTARLLIEIVAGREILRKYGRNNNSPATGSETARQALSLLRNVIRKT